jgi:hypothetical protein
VGQGVSTVHDEDQDLHEKRRGVEGEGEEDGDEVGELLDDLQFFSARVLDALAEGLPRPRW